ncbi:hypothetical protein H4S06_002117 [Coemansia sp. BCRC 34490]|nr:hypothetical protein H4S06_002117 [Coemansia sp. BCRC 34490]
MRLQGPFAFIASVTLAATSVLAHVSLKTPCVRYSPFCTGCPALPAGQSLDYSINAPIGTNQYVSQPLCKYTTPYATPAVTWSAGETVTVEFNPHAAIHSGGHCSFSLSYDGGKTFVVVHDELRYCFLGAKPSALVNTAAILSYSFKLPESLPSSDRAVFAWSFINSSGNREFYMNCADVAINGASSGSFSGPEMLIANYGPNSPTIPEFNGDYGTGIDLFNSRKNITVYGNGAQQAPASPVQGSYGKPQPSSIDGSSAVATLPAIPFMEPTPLAPLPFVETSGSAKPTMVPAPLVTSEAPAYHGYAAPSTALFTTVSTVPTSLPAAASDGYVAKSPHAASKCVKHMKS